MTAAVARLARWLPLAVWVGTGFVWGTTWVVIRAGLRDLPPLTFAATRTALAAAVLVALAALWHGPRRPGRAELRFWALLGIPQLGLPYALIFWAEQTITSGVTAILFATFPAFTAVTAHLLLDDEGLTPSKVAGTLLALVAVGTLVGPALGGSVPPAAPVVAVLVAAVSAAIGSVLVRRHGRATSTLWLTAVQVASGAAFLAVLAALFERGAPVRVTPLSVASVLYLALVVTVGCYLGLFWMLKRLDVTFVSMGVVLETAVGVFLGAGVLAEGLSPRVLAGLALVGGSVALVTLHGRARILGQIGGP